MRRLTMFDRFFALVLPRGDRRLVPASRVQGSARLRRSICRKIIADTDNEKVGELDPAKLAAPSANGMRPHGSR